LGLLHFYTLLSILIVTVGPFALPLLIQLILGSRSSSTFAGAGPVLARYCFYIPLLALNGISEAFVSSVATERQVHVQSLWMGGFTIAFGAAGYIFLRVLQMGAGGLVYANAINMLCRIAWSVNFIGTYFSDKDVEFSLSQAMPNGLAVQVLGTAVLWQGLSMVGITAGGVSAHVFRDLVKVAAFAVPCVAVM
jgi:oligosaccharide translocation protein RFT1